MAPRKESNRRRSRSFAVRSSYLDVHIGRLERSKRRSGRLCTSKYEDVVRNPAHGQLVKPACTWSWCVRSLNHCGADPSK